MSGVSAQAVGAREPHRHECSASKEKGDALGQLEPFQATDLPSCPPKLRGHLRCDRCVGLPVQGLSKETMTIQVSEKPEKNIGFFLMKAT